MLGGIPFAGIADHHEREVPAANAFGLDGERQPRRLAAFALPITARTIASRQVSVRDSAHEFHTPDAQFSVSKYQLMPHTGTVAAMMAAMGRPFCSAW